MISSVRLEAYGEQPSQVMEAFDLALDRLGLGDGEGDKRHGAADLVIEGTGSGGFKGRIKIDFAPMGAAAEDMWRHGGNPENIANGEFVKLTHVPMHAGPVLVIAPKGCTPEMFIESAFVTIREFSPTGRWKLLDSNGSMVLGHVEKAAEPLQVIADELDVLDDDMASLDAEEKS